MIRTTTEIQERLIKDGFSLGINGADGHFGENSQLAMRGFQARHGITPILLGQKEYRFDKETMALLFPEDVPTTKQKGTHMQNIFVNLLSSSVVLGLIRNGLLAVGAGLVTKGWVDDATLTEIVGWVMTGIGVLLSTLSNAEKHGAKEVVKAMEANPQIEVIPASATASGKPMVVVK